VAGLYYPNGRKKMDVKRNKKSFNKIVKREMEVAFSKQAQPVWFRITKYVLLGCILYFFWGTKLLAIILLTLSAFSIFLHFWYRYKTSRWTKSYGLWKHDKKGAQR
jgi:hypothetical protein